MIFNSSLKIFNTSVQSLATFNLTINDNFWIFLNAKKNTVFKDFQKNHRNG